MHSRNRVRIAEEMQSGNNVISRLMKAKADTKTSTMRTAALSGLGLNVTVAVGQQKPIAMNIKQRIVGTRGKQKGEPMRLIDADEYEKRIKPYDTEDDIDKALYNFAHYHLVTTPSAQPEPQWIPCSERLPEDLAEVNVTWINTDPEPYYDFVKDKPATGSAVCYKGDWYWYSSVTVDVLSEYGRMNSEKFDDAIKVIAWMPLPEPYQEVK